MHEDPQQLFDQLRRLERKVDKVLLAIILGLVLFIANWMSEAALAAYGNRWIVAKIAGHANPSVTLGHHTQAVQGAENAVEALERAFTA
jgi:hypothetical protein